VLGCAAILAGPALGQDAAGRRANVSGAISASLTTSDNVRLAAGSAQSDQVLQVSPSLRADLRSGRVQGSLDYTLTGVVYARNAESNELRNQLAARAAAELVENHLYVDTRATVSRSAISAFGTPANAAVLNANATEVGSLSVTPRLVGRLGPVDVEARASRDVTRAKDTDSGDAVATLASVRVFRGGLVGWSVDATRRTSEFRNARKTTDDRLYATLSVEPDVDWRAAVRAGVDRSDLLDPRSPRTDTWGASLSWQPGPRTLVSADMDHRYFGDSHSLVFQHRMARSTWRYADSRSSSTSESTRPLTAFDLYFSQFASQIPDPAERAAFVRLFLQLQGVPEQLAVGGGFLTSAVTVQRRRDLSASYSALRTTFTLLGFTSDTRRIDNVSGLPGEDLSRFGSVRQNGIVFNVGHRLAPDSSLSASLARQRSGAGIGSVASETSTVDLSWSNALGPRASLALSVRHSEADTANESALTATLNLRF
jgi:uncharacterized protein (PEP-CTERM system associated)